MNRYIFLFVAIFLLTGCDQISSESSFLKSMEGRWSQDQKAFNLHFVDGKLEMLDDAGSNVLITPSGKFDSDNNLLPVKYNFFKIYKSNSNVLVAAALLACPKSALEISFNLQFQNDDQQKESAWHICLSEFNGDEKVLLEKLIMAKESLRKDRQIDFILFNSCKNANKEVCVGLKGENGKVALSSRFVRKLNPEEQKIASYSEKFAARNAFIDRAFAEIIAEGAAKKKAENTEAETKWSLAEQGDITAQFNRGAYYWNKDIVKSLMWLNISADAANSDSTFQNNIIKFRDDIARGATTEQKAVAKELAEKCTANNFKGC